MRRLSIPSGPYLLLLVTCLLGWGFKAHCGASWTGSEQYLTGCYSDAVPFWGLRGVAAGQVPYVEARIEYPVLTGALIWAEGLVVRTIGGARGDAFDFLLVSSIVNAVLAFLVLWLIERSGATRLRLYAWAGAPALILYLGHNWDMLAVALAVGAWCAARRGQDVDAAGLAALGTAAKLFPILLLPLIGLGALFQHGRTWSQRVARSALLVAVAMAAWGAVNAPVAWWAFTNWSEFYSFSQARGGTAAATWDVLRNASWWVIAPEAVNRVAFLSFAGGAALIVVLGGRRHAARPWVLFTPVLAWFLLTNKVWSPQFDLWLWPFLVLTVRRPWLLAWFAVGDLAAYWAEFWWFATLDGVGLGVTQLHIAVAWVVRAGAMLAIIGEALVSPPPAWLGDDLRQS